MSYQEKVDFGEPLKLDHRACISFDLLIAPNDVPQDMLAYPRALAFINVCA
ncbi:hypothetical protein GGE35_005508 [Rhizobium cellulosilyticum]|uniref:Uncharacterized protein n=1 Tax=Aliirhizobium cellulosilyticum TaxID=393664 RepID=A0A7W6V482_9HYPH|nr:hypothetical protein [Rhizobium cellulosilyticum]MBB4415019.1 hypothetical protein [Rhizobium cellulosilyticum]MBB4449651.1 hypothetical protein [Rhizobium cellulosilyticum]